MNIGDRYEIFGTGNIYEITGKNESGYWIVSVFPDKHSRDGLDGVLISTEIVKDGMSTGKLKKVKV